MYTKITGVSAYYLKLYEFFSSDGVTVFRTVTQVTLCHTALPYHPLHYGSTLASKNISYCYSEVAVKSCISLKYMILNVTDNNDRVRSAQNEKARIRMIR